MIAQLKRLGSDSLLYAFMNVGTKLIAFALFPFYTYYLADVAEFGRLDIIDRSLSMLTFLVIFGTDSALAYYYYDVKDTNERLKYIRSVMMIRLTILLVIVGGVFTTGPYLSSWILDGSNYVYLFYIALGTLMLDTILAVVLTVLRYQFKTKKVVLLTLSKMLLIAVLSLAVLHFISPTVEGVLMARLAATLAITLLVGTVAIKFIKPIWDKAIFKKILWYAAPLVPASLAFWVILNMNTFVLKEFRSLEEVGIYGTAIKFATFITLLTSGIQLAWRPFSMEKKDNPDTPILFSKIYALLLVVGGIGILLLTEMMPWIIKVLEDSYQSAYIYVGPIAIATFLNFYYLIVSSGIFFTKKTKVISYVFGAVSVFSIVAALLVIPPYGIWGAIVVYVFSYAIATVIIYGKSQQYYYVPLSIVKLISSIVLICASVALLTWIQLMDFTIIWHVLPWILFFVGMFAIRLDKIFKTT